MSNKTTIMQAMLEQLRFRMEIVGQNVGQKANIFPVIFNDNWGKVFLAGTSANGRVSGEHFTNPVDRACNKRQRGQG